MLTILQLLMMTSKEADPHHHWKCCSLLCEEITANLLGIADTSAIPTRNVTLGAMVDNKQCSRGTSSSASLRNQCPVPPQHTS